MKKSSFTPLRSDIAWQDPDAKLAPALLRVVWPVVELRFESVL